MIKVMIVFYGLVMFVPEGEMDAGTKAEELTVMFVDGGSHLPGTRHEPRVRAVDRAGNPGPRWSLPANFEIVVAETAGTEPIGLDARREFAELRPLFTYADRGYVRSDCRKNRPSCRIVGDDLVQGTVRVEGEWTTHAATFCNGGWKLPVDDYDEAVFEFRRGLSGGSHEGMGQRQLATTLVLETDVASLNDLAVTSGGTPVSLETLPNAACGRWIKRLAPGQECVILLMGSPPVEYQDCTGAECFMDYHFSAYYRTTVDPPIRRNRWLPFVVRNEECPTPDAREVTPAPAPQAEIPPNPPAVRCPPPFATAEP